MRTADIPVHRGTQQCFCQWTGVGRPLPACWLWLLVDGGYGRKTGCNEWFVSSPLFLVSETKWTGNGWQRLTVTILSTAVLSRLHTGTATPSVPLWVSSLHAVMKASESARGGADFLAMGGKKLL